MTEPEDDILEAIAERIRSLVIALDEDALAYLDTKEWLA